MMTKLKTLGVIVALSIGVMTGTALSLYPGHVAAQEIYGSQLMTEQERLEYRAKLQNAKTVEERERIQLEHHTAMQERAKQQGVTLPDVPPAQGMGQNMGQGVGQGMGQGMGQGSGQGMGGGQGAGGGGMGN